MMTLVQDTALCISAPDELTAMTVAAFREETRATLNEEHTRLDINLKGTSFIDSSGLGTLIALQKTMNARGAKIRLLNPSQPVLQILELTRMHRLFEITRL